MVNHTNVVQFDATSPEHRQAVRDFMKRGTWADTKLRFYPPAYGSTEKHVKEELLKWFLSQEQVS